MAQLDEKHYEDIHHAQTAIDQLTIDLATARQRLPVRINSASCAVSTASTATSVDDGAGTRAELHPATAAGVVRVTGRADECRARLTALQEWARAVARPPD